ncbi:MAG: hypothetical protein KDD61_18445, partial [Bdellovibrionales bacterium]|nr:hypothetical protein [Bdellovibrionales bacterium]
YSSEVGISLLGIPANFVLSNLSAGVQASWDAVGGATSYTVLRAEVAGGPYGVVGSSGSTNFVDSTAVADETYYYIVIAEFVDGSKSPHSIEASIVRSGSVKFQVPIELFDRKIGSDATSSRTFQRSMTRINSNDYDGVTGVFFEVNATNFEGSSRNVYLVDSGDNVVATIAVPANTSESTRMAVAMSLNIGADTYRIKLDQTTSSLDVVLNSGRVLINQSDATKTKIYYPLVSSRDSATFDDLMGSIDTTSSQSYVDLQDRLFFKRETGHLKNIVEYNGWELEALVSVSSSASGKLVFHDESAGEDLLQTETRFFDSQIQMANIYLDEGSSYWSSAEEDHLYSLRYRCEYDCSSGSVSIYKAGIWVKLENLDKAAVVYRVSTAQGFVGGDMDVTSERTLIDTSLFSNAVIYFQADATDDGSSSLNLSLLESANESGVGGLSIVPSSTLSFDTNGRSFMRSAAPISLTSGQKFMSGMQVIGGNVDLHSSSLIIRVSKP